MAALERGTELGLAGPVRWEGPGVRLVARLEMEHVRDRTKMMGSSKIPNSVSFSFFAPTKYVELTVTSL